jgi:hypothetical protein
MFKQLLVAAAVALALAGTASAETIRIDFETIPGADGKLGTADDMPMPLHNITLIRDELAAAGIRFSAGTLFQDSFFDGNPSNHFLSSTNPVGTFSIPVYGISIESNSYWNATLYAYDSHGNVLASNRVINDTGTKHFSVLSLMTTEAIAGFAVQPDNPNYILNLDNMVLTTTAPVPEPASYAMLAGGLALLGWRARRRAGSAAA